MVKRVQVLIVFSLLLFCYQSQLVAQCHDFDSRICLSRFGEFIPDENNNLAQMKEGETAELFKTFFSGQTYRMVVCKPDNMPPVHVKVVDGSGKILFDNKNHNFELIWDFEVKGTQKLIVQLKVLEKTTGSGVASKAECLSILFGIQKD